MREVSQSVRQQIQRNLRTHTITTNQFQSDSFIHVYNFNNILVLDRNTITPAASHFRTIATHSEPSLHIL